MANEKQAGPSGKGKNVGGGRGWNVVGDPESGMVTMTMLSPFGQMGLTLDREQLRLLIYALQDEYKLFPEIPGTDDCATCGFTRGEHGQPRACKSFVAIK